MSGIIQNYKSLIGGFEGTGGNADTHIQGSGADIQIFTNTTGNRTWVKPSWATMVYIECIGGGAGGGTGHYGSAGRGGAGGGGASMTRFTFAAESLASTMTVVVGAAISAGNPGNHSQVTSGSKVILKAYGGWLGEAGNSSAARRGGGGGGTGSRGAANATNHWKGGYPDIQSATHGDSLAGRGGAGAESAHSYHDGHSAE